MQVPEGAVQNLTLAAALALNLDGRAWHRAMGTEHAAVLGLWTQEPVTAFARIEELAGVGWHRLDLAVTTMRAGDFGVKLSAHGLGLGAVSAWRGSGLKVVAEFILRPF